MQGRVLLILAIALTCLTSCGGSSIAPSESQDKAISNLVAKHNALRIGAGLSPYSGEAGNAICEVARHQAEYMASIGALSSVDGEGKTIREQIDAEGAVIGATFTDFQAMSTSSEVLWESISADQSLTNCIMDSNPNCCIAVAMEPLWDKQYWCIIYVSPLGAPN